MGLLKLAKLEMPKSETPKIGEALTQGFQALAKKKKAGKSLADSVKKSEDESFTPDEDWSQA